jgi:glycosyltransferase involved in cell wall biosynthesis
MIKLSIIIPSKNEEKYIEGVINSINNSYVNFEYEVILCDISDDKTREIAKQLNPDIIFIKGGPTSYARNQGAKCAKGEYLIFIDADVSWEDKCLLSNSIDLLNNGYEMVTTKLKCNNNWIVNIIYYLNYIAQLLSLIDKKPFATGTFMCISKNKFKELGGFDETALHCEDYLLSKQINHKKFKILNKYIYTDDRRFKKMGYWGMIKYFIKNIFKRNNKEYFKKDINYWL